ncbi:MAG TPA: c-type cytochrome [Pyrinomonadaceae bacterium]|nr:c-type cytochrome [Pyrinomonadaceae bacterium]
MSNTEFKEKGRSREAWGRSAPGASRRALLTVCLLPFAFFLLACRQDMQDQPRYEVYEPSQSFKDGQASRPLVEGTVARGQLRENTLLYTGRTGGAGIGQTASGAGLSGSQTGVLPGGTGAAQPNVQTGGALMPAGAGRTSQTGQQGGDVNVRGSAANTTAAQGGPDVFPFEITADVLRQGRTRYEQFCAMCHGPMGNADGMIVRRGFQRPPSFHDDRLQEGQTAASHFFDVITNGFGAMPDYASMIAVEDRWKIIAYVRVLQLSRRATEADVPPDKRGQLRGANGTGGAGGAQTPAAAGGADGGGGGH